MQTAFSRRLLNQICRLRKARSVFEWHTSWNAMKFPIALFFLKRSDYLEKCNLFLYAL